MLKILIMRSLDAEIKSIQEDSVSHSIMSSSCLSCPELDMSSPSDCSIPGSSVHGILQAKYRSGFSFLSPGYLPDMGGRGGGRRLKCDLIVPGTHL